MHTNPYSVMTEKKTCYNHDSASSVYQNRCSQYCRHFNSLLEQNLNSWQSFGAKHILKNTPLSPAITFKTPIFFSFWTSLYLLPCMWWFIALRMHLKVKTIWENTGRNRNRKSRAQLLGTEPVLASVQFHQVENTPLNTLSFLLPDEAQWLRS